MVYAKEKMITYTWNIIRLDCAPSENGLTNVVKVIHWGLAGQDENGISASINNSYPLPSPTPEVFTDYSTLTQEIIIGWLESSLDVEYIQSILTKEIESRYNPPITPLPLPWIKVEEPIVEEVIPTEEVISTEEPIVEEVISTEEVIPTEEPIVEEVISTEEPIVEEVISTEEVIPTEEPIVEEVIPTEEPIVEEVISTEEPTLEEMIADGYKPDVRDGDGDGTVQDGTDWERPIDTQE